MLDAAAYYEEASAGLGYAFLTEMETVFATIKGCPDRRQMLNPPYRRALLQCFPYGVIYRHQEQTCYVVAIMHLKRKPGYWLHRVTE